MFSGIDLQLNIVSIFAMWYLMPNATDQGKFKAPTGTLREHALVEIKYQFGENWPFILEILIEVHPNRTFSNVVLHENGFGGEEKYLLC